MVDAKLKPGEDTSRHVPDMLTDREVAAALKNECLSILQSPPELRSDTQRSHLIKWLRSHNSVLLKELSNKVLDALCSKVVFQTFPSQKVVFKQGAPSDAFYIILTGSVSIWINTGPTKGATTDESEVFNQNDEMVAAGIEDDETTTTRNEVKETHAHRNEEKSSDSSPRGSDETDSNESVPSLTRSKKSLSLFDLPSKYKRPVGVGISSNLTFVGVMSAGDEKCAFGELGLVSGEPRSATIKCEDHTELLRVSKDDFHTVLKTYSESLKRRVALIATFPGFRIAPKPISIGSMSLISSRRGRRKALLAAGAISEKYISKLSMFFKEYTLHHPRSILFSQGDKCDRIFFLVDGEVEVLQQVAHQFTRPPISGTEPIFGTKKIEVVLTRIAATYPQHIRQQQEENDEAKRRHQQVQADSRNSVIDEGKEEAADLKNGAHDSDANSSDGLTGAAFTEEVLNASRRPIVLPSHTLQSSQSSSSSVGVDRGAFPSSSTTGQILGESPLFIKSLKGCYDTTVRTIGPCSFLVISKMDFLRRMNFLLLSRFKAGVREKMKWRAKRLEEIALPKEVLTKGGHIASLNAIKNGSNTTRAGVGHKISNLLPLDLKSSISSSSSSSLSAPSTFRSNHKYAHHQTSLALQSWSLRQKQLQLAAHKNIRLLPTLTHPTADSSNNNNNNNKMNYSTNPPAIKGVPLNISGSSQTGLHAPNSSSAAPSSQHNVFTNPHDSVSTSLPLSSLFDTSVPLPSRFLSELEHTSIGTAHVVPSDPIHSASRFITGLNPTISLTRRGSFGLAPDLRPLTNLAELQQQQRHQPQQQERKESKEFDNNDAASLAANDLIPLPHSIPMTLAPTAPPSQSLIPSPRRSSILTAYSSLHVVPSPAHTSLTPADHLILTNELRSSEASQRAKQIVKVMQEMKDRKEEWVVTPNAKKKMATKKKQDYNQNENDNGDVINLPVDDVRMMWQRREEKREKKKWSIDEQNQSNANGVGKSSANLAHAGDSSLATNWQHLNLSTSTSHSESHPSPAPLVDPLSDLRAILEASSNSRARRLKELAILGNVQHQLQMTPQLLQDLSVIAPKSSILQTALSLGTRAKNTQTHRTITMVATSNAQLLHSIDWPIVMATTHAAPVTLSATDKLVYIGGTLHPGANPHNTTGILRVGTVKELADYKDITPEELIAHTHAMKEAAKSNRLNPPTEKDSTKSDPNSNPSERRFPPHSNQFNRSPNDSSSNYSHSHFIAKRFPSSVLSMISTQSTPFTLLPTIPCASSDHIHITKPLTRYHRSDKSGYQPMIRYK